MGKEKRKRKKKGPDDYSYLADNIKAVLILLVVFNHMIAFQIVRSDETIRHVWYAITIFHMPAFVFVSGYLSKHPQSQIKNFKNLLIPYVFGYALTWFAYYWLGHPMDFEILRPSGSAMWYLMALLFYRLTIEATGKVRGVVIVGIAVSLLAGMRPEFSTYLSMSRIVVFFPFFAAGYLWKPEHTEYIRHFAGKLVFVLVSGALLFLVPDFMIRNKLPIDIFRGNHSYQMSGLPNETGMFLRFLMYFVSFIVIMMLFSLVPQIKLSGFIGRNTMSVYLLHYPLLIVLNGLRILQLPQLMTWWGCLGFSFVIVLILSSPPIYWLYAKLMQFFCFLIFHKETEAETEPVSEGRHNKGIEETHGVDYADPKAGIPERASLPAPGSRRRTEAENRRRRSITLAHKQGFGQGGGQYEYEEADDESVGRLVYGENTDQQRALRTGSEYVDSRMISYYEDPRGTPGQEPDTAYARPRKGLHRRRAAGNPGSAPQTRASTGPLPHVKPSTGQLPHVRPADASQPQQTTDRLQTSISESLEAYSEIVNVDYAKMVMTGTGQGEDSSEDAGRRD